MHCSHLEEELWFCLSILFQQTACREEVLCLSCQAWLFWDKRAAPLSLCKRSHRSGRRSKSSNRLCFPRTHTVVHLSGLALCTHLCTHVTSFTRICAHVDCLMKDALSKMLESPHIYFPSGDMFQECHCFCYTHTHMLFFRMNSADLSEF